MIYNKKMNTFEPLQSLSLYLKNQNQNEISNSKLQKVFETITSIPSTKISNSKNKKNELPVLV